MKASVNSASLTGWSLDKKHPPPPVVRSVSHINPCAISEEHNGLVNRSLLCSVFIYQLPKEHSLTDHDVLCSLPQEHSLTDHDVLCSLPQEHSLTDHSVLCSLPQEHSLTDHGVLCSLPQEHSLISLLLANRAS